MRRHLAAVAAFTAIFAWAPLAGAASAPENWDGLTRVASKKFDYVYLLPGADFRPYTKVMLDPTEVAFQKDWLRNYNDQQVDSMSRISDSDAQQMLSDVQKGFEQSFRKVYANSGLQIVQAPGPDVLRVRTAVVNLNVVAPDTMTPGRSMTFSRDAGSASVIIEARDSTSNALLGRAVDNRVLGDGGPYLRNSVTNRADFERLFEQWAKISAEGLSELKLNSPVGGTVAAK